MHKILLGYKEKKGQPEFLGTFPDRTGLQEAINNAPEDFQFFEAGQLMGYPMKRRAATAPDVGSQKSEVGKKKSK